MNNEGSYSITGPNSIGRGDDVSAFLQTQKAKLEDEEKEAARRNAYLKEVEVNRDQHTRALFKATILPEIVRLDKTGTKKYHIGIFNTLPRVWLQIAEQNSMFITVGEGEYLCYPPKRDYYINWR